MSHDIQNRGPIFFASFASTALSTAGPVDVFGILPPTNSRVQIHEIVLGQTSTDQLNLSVQLLRGSTASSTSAAITPRHIHGWPTAPTAGSSVTGPSTTLVSTASAVLLYADAFKNAHWCYSPAPQDRPILNLSQRLHVRVSAPSSGLYGSVTWSESGKPAST